MLQMVKQHNSPTIHCFSTWQKLMMKLMKFNCIKRQSNTTYQFKSGFGFTPWRKIHMLEFYFNFFVKCFDRSKFELSQMDTDSLYFAISCETLETILKPEIRLKYYRNRHLWLPSELCNNCIADYVTTKVAGCFWKIITVLRRATQIW